MKLKLWIPQKLRPTNSQSRLSGLLVRWLCLLGLVLSSGCDTLGYYGQAINGQVRILAGRQDIERLLSAPTTDPTLKQRLAEVQAIRRFAADQLHLPLASQYSTYVALERPYVVWNVFAAPEFSLEPLSWCYPVAGCVSYRGYFSEQAAQEYAAGLRKRGLEVHVGGVAAYSTLGWFSDPVLSSILNRPSHQLATLLFHELAHQVAYVPGDTEFNESFATAVEQEGLQRWLQASVSDTAEREALALAVQQDGMRQQQFVALVQTAVADLARLYAEPFPAAEMRLAKQQRLSQLQADYAVLKQQQWQGYSGYDAWFGGDLNNARLGTVATYNNLVPAFKALLAQQGRDLPAFYAAVKELAAFEPEARRNFLQSASQTGAVRATGTR
jgi:predicted aminopeptidase